MTGRGAGGGSVRPEPVPVRVERRVITTVLYELANGYREEVYGSLERWRGCLLAKGDGDPASPYRCVRAQQRTKTVIQEPWEEINP